MRREQERASLAQGGAGCVWFRTCSKRVIVSSGAARRLRIGAWPWVAPGACSPTRRSAPASQRDIYGAYLAVRRARFCTDPQTQVERRTLAMLAEYQCIKSESQNQSQTYNNLLRDVWIALLLRINIVIRSASSHA